MDKKSWENQYVKGEIDKNAKGDVQTDAEIADHNQFQIAYYEYRKKLKQINNEESFNQ